MLNSQNEIFPGKREILYEDNHLLILNKRPGLLVQGDKSGDLSVVDLAKDYLRQKYNKPGNVFIGLAHRIDRPASGIVILCKTSKSLSRVAQAFKSKQIKKSYFVIVKNQPPVKRGKLVNWLKKDNVYNKVKIFDSEIPGALKAELEYEILGKNSGNYLLKVNLLTGRPHQIRAQLSAINCPVAGDMKYGDHEPGPSKSIFLHAAMVEFMHPVKKEKLKVSAPPPSMGLWKLFKDFQLNLK